MHFGKIVLFLVIEKAKRAAELQAKINSTLAAKPGLLASVTDKIVLPV